MANYLDLTGLTRFKEKQDLANEAKFLKKADFDSTINEKLTNVYKYKGTKPSFSDLPQTGNVAGDVWDVNGGMNYAWDGTKWDALGESKVEITIDSEIKSDSENPVQNKVIYSALQEKASVDDAKKVTQTVAADNDDYPILVKNSSGTTTVTDTSKFASGVTVNPSSGNISATSFTGKLIGNADSATTATTADKAKTADKATSADKATTAESATTAATADKATSATTAEGLSVTLGIEKGGTGATTSSEAWTALGGGSVGKLNTNSSTTQYLRGDGTWGTPENTTYDAISTTEIDNLFK